MFFVNTGEIHVFADYKGDGQEFLGWYNGDIKVDSGGTLSGSVILQAKWKVKTGYAGDITYTPGQQIFPAPGSKEVFGSSKTGGASGANQRRIPILLALPDGTSLAFADGTMNRAIYSDRLKYGVNAVRTWAPRGQTRRALLR